MDRSDFRVMVIIDAHVHLYPDEVNRAPGAWAEARGERQWTTLCTRVRKDGRAVQDFPTVDELLRALDTAGVERAVLLGWYWENHATCAEQNRFYAACVRAHPARLMACATLNPRAGRTAVLGEMARALDDGLVGLGELSPHAQGFAVDDPVWTEVLALAGERGVPVNLHVTEPAGKNYPGRVETPLEDFVAMARAHPATRFILAHWGGRLPLDARLGAEARALTNVCYDTAAAPLIYPNGQRRTLAREMVDAVGAERVLFGSDFPLVLYPGGGARGASIRGFVDEVRACGWGEGELRSAMGGTAERLFANAQRGGA